MEERSLGAGYEEEEEEKRRTGGRGQGLGLVHCTQLSGL